MERLASSSKPFEESFNALHALWFHERGARIGLSPDWPSDVASYAYKIAPDLAQHLGSHLTPGCSPPVVTHGDPTLDNLMSREGTGDPVFVDPLPPERHTPPVRALDVGKALQSLWGWHEVEYGKGHPQLARRTEITRKLLSPLPLYEINACWAFAAYHLIRALPYAKNRQPVYAAARKILEGMTR